MKCVWQGIVKNGTAKMKVATWNSKGHNHCFTNRWFKKIYLSHRLTLFLPKEMKSSNTASSWNQFSRSSAWFWFSTCPNWEGKMTHRISGKKEQRMTLIITNIQHQTCEIWLTRSVRAFLPPFLENKSKWIVISHLEWFQLFWFFVCFSLPPKLQFSMVPPTAIFPFG